MLWITTTRADGTEHTITLEVIVTTDSASPGIQRVQVLTRGGPPAIDMREFECDRFAHFYVEGVERRNLPVYIVGTECDDPDREIPAETTVAGPFLNEERADADLGAFPVICRPTFTDMPNVNNSACLEANRRAQRLRNGIRLLCTEAANLRRQRDESAVVAATAYVAAAALAAAAGGASAIPIIGQAVAVLLVIAAAIALVVAISASIAAAVFSVQLGDKLGEIRTAQEEYAFVVDEIQRVCCPEFISVPLDAPGCD